MALFSEKYFKSIDKDQARIIFNFKELHFYPMDQCLLVFKISFYFI
jgi:hypothetical protein